MNYENEKDYIYKCENGKDYGIPYDKKCCLICKHCTDIFYDYTNGPYMCFCEFCNESCDEFGDECNQFELVRGTLTVKDILEGW